MEVKMLRTVTPPKSTVTIQQGETLKVRERPLLFGTRCFQIIDGPSTGVYVNDSDCIPLIELDAETASIVQRLQAHIVNLHRELSEAREAKKVPLPRAVAEAVDLCLSSDITAFGIISLLNVTGQLFRDHPQNVIDALIQIRQFSYYNAGEDCVGDTGADILLKALVNDYTVEQSPDDYVVAQYVSFRIANKHDEADAMISVITLLGKTDLLKRMEQAGGTTRS